MMQWSVCCHDVFFHLIPIVSFASQYADPHDEPTCEPYDESFEEQNKSVDEWKSLIWDILEKNGVHA